MDAYEQALSLLPKEHASALRAMGAGAPEEIRLRVGRSPSLLQRGTENATDSPPVKEEDIVRVLQKATGASLYSASRAMRQGFYCLGALRIGVCGTLTPGGEGTGYSSYSSLCIRIAHEHKGVCRDIAKKLMSDVFVNTLILSPPGGGKTTALRDIIRQLADGGRRVGVIDERGELDCTRFDLGRCSDVISGADKLTGAMLLLRSMTPQIIAADEISTPDDLKAAEEIFACGTGLLATAHAADEHDLFRRSAYRSLAERGVFRRAVVIRNIDGRREYAIRELACSS